jgi:GGDEF domain-containing protein
LEEPLLLEGLKFDVRPRIGIALFPEHSSNADNLVHRADIASQRLKEQGTNTYSTLTNRTMPPCCITHERVADRRS